LQFALKVNKLAFEFEAKPLSLKETWRWLKSMLHERDKLRVKCNQQQHVLEKAELIISMGQTSHSFDMRDALGLCT
jgi:hypothetical protein